MLFSSLFIFAKLFILLPQPSTSTLTLLNFPFFFYRFRRLFVHVYPSSYLPVYHFRFVSVRLIKHLSRSALKTHRIRVSVTLAFRLELHLRHVTLIKQYLRLIFEIIISASKQPPPAVGGCGISRVLIGLALSWALLLSSSTLASLTPPTNFHNFEVVSRFSNHSLLQSPLARQNFIHQKIPFFDNDIPDKNFASIARSKFPFHATNTLYLYQDKILHSPFCPKKLSLVRQSFLIPSIDR